MLDEKALETAAAALRDHALNRLGRGKPWDKLREEIKTKWRDEARVVIEVYHLYVEVGKIEESDG